MTDEVIQTIKSEDSQQKVEILRGSHGRFRYLEFTWVPYDEKFKLKLRREGDWQIGNLSGLYETAKICAEDARLALGRLGK